MPWAPTFWVGHGAESPHPVKTVIVEKILMIAAGGKHLKCPIKIKFCFLYSLRNLM
jgi:hypothetical protein